MIISKTVMVKISNRNYNYYEKLGYSIPKLFNNNDKIHIEKGTVIEVKVEDLTFKSPAIILAKCEVCEKTRYLKYCHYKKNCVDCSRIISGKKRSGEKNSYYKDGRTLIRKKCKTCENTNVLFCNSRCSDCLKQVKENNKKKNYCIDCCAEIKSKKSKRCSSCANNGINNPSYNPNLSEDDRKTKQKCALGISKWRRKVVKRDGYTCKCCGFVGKEFDGKINAHHINNFKDNENLRFDLDNGICLCLKCHKLFHRKYGKRDNNEQQLREFIDGYIDKKIE